MTETASEEAPAEPPAGGTSVTSRVVQIGLVRGLGGGALYLALRGVHWDDFVAVLKSADVPVFLSGMGLFATLHIVRAVRWGALVRAVKPEVSFYSFLSICSVGFFLINTLPFRLGEFARPYLLFEREDVSFGSGLATVVVERMLDIAALGVIFLGVLLLADLPAEPVEVAGGSYDIISMARTSLLGVFVPVGTAVAVLLAMGNRGVEIGAKLAGRVHPRIGAIARRLLQGFVDALRALGSVRKGAPVIVWTAVVWGINVLSIYWMAKAFEFGAALGFWDGATILVCICVALILPAPPGFAGVFELAVVIALAIYGVSRAEAVAFSVAVHGSQFLIIGSVGVFFLVRDKIRVSRLLTEIRELRTAPVEG